MRLGIAPSNSHCLAAGVAGVARGQFGPKADAPALGNATKNTSVRSRAIAENVCLYLFGSSSSLKG